MSISVSRSSLRGKALLLGAWPPAARVAVVAVHGRGQDASYIRTELVEHLPSDLNDIVAYVLPEAPEQSWYPGRFFDPLADNEPQLSAALDALRSTLQSLADAGIPAQRTVLVGFSQGACLIAELAYRAARPYAGVAILTGALIGPPDLERPAPKGLEGVPIFVGNARDDAWVSLRDSLATGKVFEAAGAEVEVEVYDEPEHAIYPQERLAVEALIRGALQRGSGGEVGA